MEARNRISLFGFDKIGLVAGVMTVYSCKNTLSRSCCDGHVARDP
jgi:hypothetical protein